jgi:hypothetical protein
MPDTPIKPTTKAILLFNVFVGNLPSLRAKKYIKKQAREIKKSLIIPEDFVFYIHAVSGQDRPQKAIEVIRLDGKENKEERMFPKEWEDIVKKRLEEQEITFGSGNVCEGCSVDEDKSNLINVRISDDDKEAMLEKSEELGFKNLSDYLRFVGLNAEMKVEVPKKD